MWIDLYILSVQIASGASLEPIGIREDFRDAVNRGGLRATLFARPLYISMDGHRGSPSYLLSSVDQCTHLSLYQPESRNKHFL